MTVYKENVLDIINNWEGYQIQDPCARNLAQNAGAVELKCFINNICPFFASAYEEDTLVFNENTYRRIVPWLPDTLTGSLSVTPGTQGMHFRPRFVFRNNYVYHKFSKEIGDVVDSDINPVDDLYDNFDINYQDISQIDPSNSKVVPGADETRYKEEQSWIVTKSIFDPLYSIAGENECDAKAEWGYKSQRVSDSEVTEDDLKYDYNLEYYEDYYNSWDRTKKPYKLRRGERLLINKTRVQMPVQKRVSTDTNGGVHWRLMKRTPLFKGEDFFIRFYRQAEDTVIDPNDTDSGDGIASFSNEFSQYFPLDVTRNDLLDMGSRFTGETGLMRERNFAICPPTTDSDKSKWSYYKKYDFHDQAYYIIELGVGSYDERYFIIICERANPIFVNFVPAVPNTLSGIAEVSKKLSEFDEISGKQLIHASSFEMSVRNHLGSIVVQFYGPGINVPPWVIKRWDWIPDQDPVSKEFYMKDKVRSMTVPRGRMVIMGGNIRSGFLFEPLQYSTEYLSMIYPPRESVAKENDMKLAFTLGDPEEISARSMSGAFKSSPFFLPSQGAHDIMFSSTDIFLEDLYKHTVPVGESAVNQPLFMQDAQYYKNYYESDDPTNPGRGRYRVGGYVYNDPLKSFSDDGGNVAVRTSNIIVKKYKYLNDPKTKKQAFEVVIGMMCGDHLFIKNSWGSVEPSAPGKAKVELGKVDYTTIPDNQWFLRSCKTPILTSLRLISHESKEPRWSDGTSISSGTNFTPLEGTSPYFIDASDHVMSYSDSWSASGFSEMEHTGSLNFYLNRGMPVDNNVTDALISLQNKTFYVEIWGGYNRPCVDSGYSSYSRQEGMFKLFTGLCHGGSLSYEYGKTIMSCKVEDYTVVLKGTRFFNSPWFDGVKDINCIHEILQMSGFRDIGKYDAGSLVKYLSNNTSNGSSGVFFHHFDGRLFKMEPYALPSGYNRLEQPAFKFNDGDPYMDAVVKIAKRAGKVFFFDQFGIAHYENFQDMIQSDYLGKVPISSLCSFTTNPEIYPGQMVFNKMERNYDVGGIINHIKIMTNTPDFHLLIGDDLNWSSMVDPDSEGFIGYLKSMYQQESMFGSKEAMLDTIRKYSVAFRPKIKSKFETYGVPLRANDIISINGENTRVVKVSHNIIAEKNEWWMEVETEKYQIVNASRSTE